MIIPFPAKPHVTISSKMVTETCRVTCDSTRCIRHDPPERTYFLEFVERDGRTIVWDGPTYLAALAAANDWASEGIEVCDDSAVTEGRA